MQNKLVKILGFLKALQFHHQAAHWKVTGESFYSDHLLFERLYENLNDDIDTLAEKIISFFGEQAIDPLVLIKLSHYFVHKAYQEEPECIISRSLLMEENLQEILEDFYSATEEALSMGLDDFIMSLAGEHEEHIYLLRQRLS